MFDRYVTGRGDKHARSKGLALGASLILNSGLVASLLLFSFWKIEKLQAKTVPLVFRASAAPPAPPPPPSGIPAPREVSKVKTPAKPHELVQPTDTKPPELATTAPASTEPGTPEGQPEGIPGGVTCQLPGTCDGPTGPVTGQIVEPPKPINVPIDGVEAARLSGTREIPLPLAVKQAVVAQGKHQVTAAVKLCLDTRGVPASVKLIGSTGYPEADDRIRAEVSDWRYRPYTVNGQPVPVCTAVMFRYQIE